MFAGRVDFFGHMFHVLIDTAAKGNDTISKGDVPKKPARCLCVWSSKRRTNRGVTTPYELEASEVCVLLCVCVYVLFAVLYGCKYV